MSHNHHHQPQDPSVKERAAISIFWRVFRRFAGPYWFRLTVGIVASLIMGGAVATLFRVIDHGLNAFDQSTTTNSQQVSAVAHAESVDTAVQAPVMPQPKDLELQPNTSYKLPKVDNDKTDKHDKAAKIEKYLTTAENICHKIGIDIKFERSGKLTIQLLIFIVVGSLLLFLLKSAGEFTAKYSLRWVAARIVTDIRIALFTNIQKQSISFFDKTDVGQLIARCTNDTAAIEHSIASSVAELFTGPFMILASFQFIVAKAYEMELLSQSIWLIISMPVCIVPIMFLSRFIRKYQKRVLAGVATLVAAMQENFSGIHVVKIFNAEKTQEQVFTAKSNNYFKSVCKALLADILMQPTMQLVCIAIGGVFLCICFRYNVTLASIATLAFAAQEAYRPIKDIAKLNNDLQKSAAACERILALLDAHTALPVCEPVVSPQAFEREIVFDHIFFQYSAETPEVIHDFNLTIKKGQLVAIVGPTGSGKSTVANLLARFYDPTQGSIQLDGTDLKHIDNTALRKLIGVVSQDTFLFNDTIQNNIRFGTPDATDEDIQIAARNANAEPFIIDNPLQYARPVGERGNNLSGGQKQRLAIARALLKNPPILILDEATSALDTKTEKAVQAAFDTLMTDRTVLAIAHRFSTILNADLILVVDHGRIIEQGNHQQLYDLNGSYRKLYDLQFATAN